MKKLFIIRHAKSSWDNMDLRDFDRPLNERGLKDAPYMGKRLKEHGIHPDLMVSSPAVRALATCRALARELDYPEDKIRIDKRLYHAAEEQLLTVLKECRKFHDPAVLVVVGHNPGLTGFTNRLLDDSIDNIPTCGIVAGELKIRSWEEVDWGCGERRFFETPKD
jgi:phosphohistidine phosphatase